MRGRGVAGTDGAAGQTNSSARARMRILTPDSSSRGSIWPFGRKCSRLGRICSGSRDRPVLGHLCTNRPGNACIGTARARERACTHGGRAAGPAHWVWGTAAKQRQVSHAHHGQAAAGQRMHLHAAVKAQLRLSVLSCSSDHAAQQRSRCVCPARQSTHIMCASRPLFRASAETSLTPSPKPRD